MAQDSHQSSYTYTVLCRLDNKSCFGCCGRRFGSKEKVLAVIEKSTQELIQIKDRWDFRMRAKPSDLHEGTCRNLVFDQKKEKVFCPLHPLQNNGVDLRVGHCDFNFLCTTAKKFETWNREKQQSFIQLLRSKNVDVYEYSMGMDKDLFLKEFEQANP
ncbi:hypothetical protein J4457_01025 [Candidatus Woesearchaeota archaeon]|nr:hypothetical protein [Candidatus Woesearchaeota archaeon]